MSYAKIRRPLVKEYKNGKRKFGPLPSQIGIAPDAYILRLKPRNDRSPNSSPSRAGELLDAMMHMQSLNPKGFRNVASGKHHKARKHLDTTVAKLARVAFGA